MFHEEDSPKSWEKKFPSFRNGQLRKMNCPYTSFRNSFTSYKNADEETAAIELKQFPSIRNSKKATEFMHLSMYINCIDGQGRLVRLQMENFRLFLRQ
jgi:hypothetical protein